MGRRRMGSGEGEDEGAEAGALGLVKRAEDGLGVVDGEEGEGDGMVMSLPIGNPTLLHEHTTCDGSHHDLPAARQGIMTPQPYTNRDSTPLSNPQTPRSSKPSGLPPTHSPFPHLLKRCQRGTQSRRMERAGLGQKASAYEQRHLAAKGELGVYRIGMRVGGRGCR